jgi:hypothetical protein
MALTLERFSVVLLAANLFVLVRADDYDYDYDECGNQGYGDIDHSKLCRNSLSQWDGT